MADDIKKRGRPPLTPEQKSMRTKKVSKPGISSTKEGGYASQKKYRQNHPEKYSNYYEPKIRIPKSLRENLDALLLETGLTITQLFVNAVEEKYGVVLRKHLDKNDD